MKITALTTPDTTTAEMVAVLRKHRGEVCVGVLAVQHWLSIGTQNWVWRRFGAVELQPSYTLTFFQGGYRWRHGIHAEIFCRQGLRPIKSSLMAILSVLMLALRRSQPPVHTAEALRTMSTAGIDVGRRMFLRMGDPWRLSCRFVAFAAARPVVLPGYSLNGSRLASPYHICAAPRACRTLCVTSVLPSADDLLRRSLGAFWCRQARTRSCVGRGRCWAPAQ